MNASLPFIAIASAVVAMAGGFVIGFLYFHSLHWATRFFTEGRAVSALLLQLARMAVLTGALYTGARFGAAVLIAGTLGVFTGRAIVLHRVKGA